MTKLHDYARLQDGTLPFQSRGPLLHSQHLSNDRGPNAVRHSVFNSIIVASSRIASVQELALTIIDR